MICKVKATVEKYGLITATEKGNKFLEEPYSVMLTEDREFVNTDDDDDVVLSLDDNDDIVMDDYGFDDNSSQDDYFSIDLEPFG